MNTAEKFTDTDTFTDDNKLQGKNQEKVIKMFLELEE